MGATRSSKQPDPTVADQLDEIKSEVEAIMKTIQQCLAGIQERLDRLS